MMKTKVRTKDVPICDEIPIPIMVLARPLQIQREILQIMVGLDVVSIGL